MKLSVSDMLRWNTCPYSHYAATTAGVPPATGAMRRGTAIHRAFELHLQGKSMDIDLSQVDEKDRPFVERALARLSQWTPPWTVLGTEMPLSAPLNTMGTEPTVVGRLDALVEDAAGKWSAQLKTLGKGRDMALAMEKVRMSPHEITYHWLASVQRPAITLRGTSLILLKDLTKAEQAAGVDMLTCVALPRTAVEVESAIYTDILPVFDQMEQVKSRRTCRKDWTSCYGEFGSSPCPYFEHCHNGVPLAALPLIPMEDRYEDI